MKLFGVTTFILVCVIMVSVSQADETFKTSTGEVFTQVQGPGKFGKAWKDPGGTLWSTVQGSFDNCPAQVDQADAEINAAAVCESIGGTLPLVDDYIDLKSYFEQEDDALTPQGQKDLAATVFQDAPQGKDTVYWTASYLRNALSLAQTVANDGDSEFASCESALVVRCISR